MANHSAGVASVALMLGRIIDPAGHAKDDARRRDARALMIRCPHCEASPGSHCVTRSGNRTTTHRGRYANV